MADGTARELDTAAPWAGRYAPQLRLDPASQLDRLLVDHLHDELAALGPDTLTPPLASSSRRQYERYIDNFIAWCVHTGLAPEPEQVVHLPTPVLRSAAESWIAWRVRDIEPTHPLVGRAPGGRSPQGLHQAEQLRCALKWWSLAQGLGDLLTHRARMITADPAPVRAARAPTDEEIGAIIDALLQNEVVTAITEAVTHAWHARQLAAVNVALAGSLRPTSEFALLRDENIVSAGDGVLVIRLPRTKAQPTGRLVHLHQRDDALCPVASLGRFLAMCATAGWNRGGFLLPTVYKRRYQPLGEPRGSAALADPFRLITDHLGITDDLDTGLRATPHGLRAVSPTKAFAAGMDVYSVMQLTGHTTVEAVRTYDRAIGAPDDFISAMSADLDTQGTD